jgi:hypothetical protein
MRERERERSLKNFIKAIDEKLFFNLLTRSHCFTYIVLSTIFYSSIFFSYKQQVVNFFLPLAPDGDIESPSLFLLKICLICIFTPLFIFFFSRWVSFFQKEKWVPNKLEVVCLMFIVTLHGVAILLPKVGFLWFGEDSIGEILSFIFMLSAAILTLRIAIERVVISQKICFFVFSVCFFLFALEEISYGQHLFNWEAPKFFANNRQLETNLHNFYYLGPTYFVFCLIIAVLFSMFDIVQARMPKFFEQILFVSNPSFMACFFIVLAVGSSLDGGELVEQSLSIMMLAFAIRNTKLKASS